MVGLECKICGHREKNNLKKHLEVEHKLTTKEYRCKYPGNRTMTGHSKRTVEYWMYREGYSYKQSKEAVKSFQSLGKKNYIEKKVKTGLTKEEAQKLWNEKQAKCSPRTLKHYIGKGLTEDQARDKQSKIQSKFSALSSKFSGHKHTAESKEKISNACKQMALETGHNIMARRFRSKSKNGIRSNIETECFNELKKIFPKLTANKEIGKYVVDMVLENIAIEFYGDFWHRNPKMYLAEDNFYGKTSKDIWEYDRKRVYYLTQQGYETLIIWEVDWKNNKDRVIKKINKLYENKSNNTTK